VSFSHAWPVLAVDSNLPGQRQFPDFVTLSNVSLSPVGLRAAGGRGCPSPVLLTKGHSAYRTVKSLLSD
jgi:hypothetical protein